jgi:hypothetical protein
MNLDPLVSCLIAKNMSQKGTMNLLILSSESLVYYIPGVQFDLKIEHAVMIVSGSIAISINNEPYRSMF